MFAWLFAEFHRRLRQGDQHEQTADESVKAKLHCSRPQNDMLAEIAAESDYACKDPRPLYFHDRLFCRRDSGVGADACPSKINVRTDRHEKGQRAQALKSRAREDDDFCL